MNTKIELTENEAQRLYEYIDKHRGKRIIITRHIPIEMGEITYVNAEGSKKEDITDYDSF